MLHTEVPYSSRTTVSWKSSANPQCSQLYSKDIVKLLSLKMVCCFLVIDYRGVFFFRQVEKRTILIFPENFSTLVIFYCLHCRHLF